MVKKKAPEPKAPKAEKPKAEVKEKSSGGKKIKLTNKSARIFYTREGIFHPGTTKEFGEDVAMGLLKQVGEIVKTSEYLNEKKG
jgi:hypothetical protein